MDIGYVNAIYISLIWFSHKEKRKIKYKETIMNDYQFQMNIFFLNLKMEKQSQFRTIYKNIIETSWINYKTIRAYTNEEGYNL